MAETTSEQQGEETSTDPQPAPMSKQAAERWRKRIDAATTNKKDLLSSWRQSVNYRVQRPYGGATTTDGDDRDKLALPEDWARTKQKQSMLSFQLPKIVAKQKSPEYAQMAPTVTAVINDQLKCGVKAYYMIDECLADVINASGVMFSYIGVDIRYETKDVPAEPTMPPQIPEIDLGGASVNPAGAVPAGLPIEPVAPVEPQMVPVTREVSKKFFWKRISPALALWPSEFTESNWDEAPWLGAQTWMLIEDAKKRWGKKNPKVMEMEPTSRVPELLSNDILSQSMKRDASDYVLVSEIWYYAARYDADKFHPECIRRVVFLDGIDDPVEYGETDWQEWVPEVPPTPETPPGLNGEPGQPAMDGIPGHYIGLTKLPIRVDTLTYVSDLAVPPSDSEAARPQVREMIRTRTQMLRQRDSSVPIRWFDVNRVDETIADKIRSGEWQDMIPMNGPGDRAIGEVARASYPRENWQTAGVIGNDLDRAWSLSNNQLSSLNQSERSATEVNAVQNAGQVRLDYEKARVNRYITEGAAVLFSLMQKFVDKPGWVEMVGPQGAAIMTQYQAADLKGDYAFEFLADSSDRIDLATKQANVLKAWNLVAGYEGTNKQELLKEVFQLHGMDPARFVVEPQKKGPEPPNISYRFGGDDLLNPMAVSIMMKAQEITPDEIAAAAEMIQDSVKKMQDARARMFEGGGPPTAGGGAPAGPMAIPPGEAPAAPEPPVTTEPILKRAIDGTHLT